ncbi:MAG: sensor domain-containing protein [Catenulispora sp.]|nr:sensor domain-containing protein [Catenulispora sp.]
MAGVVWLVWPDSSKPTDRVVAGTVQATVLSADDVSKLAGTTLVAAATTNQPPAALAADQAGCAVAVGPATQAVYGHDWTGFLSVTYQDLARKGSMTVTQVAAVFPSADKASAAFKTLHDGLTGCSSAVVTDHGGRASQWQYKVDAQSDTSVGWTATEPSGGAWSCHHQAQLTGTSLLQVSVCSAGDGGTVASKVADKFAAQVKAS